MMTKKDLSKLVISFFSSLEVFKRHKSDSDLTDALCFVPYTPPDNTWKQAFKGRHTSTSSPVCTLPSQWKECVIYYNWVSGRPSTAMTIYLVKGGNNDILEVNEEIYIDIKPTNVVTMYNNGKGGDGVVKEVWWR